MSTSEWVLSTMRGSWRVSGISSVGRCSFDGIRAGIWSRHHKCHWFGSILERVVVAVLPRSSAYEGMSFLTFPIFNLLSCLSIYGPKDLGIPVNYKYKKKLIISLMNSTKEKKSEEELYYFLANIWPVKMTQCSNILYVGPDVIRRRQCRA